MSERKSFITVRNHHLFRWDEKMVEAKAREIGGNC
ncbi:hypothetical protein ES703_47654 [subsurface metagenome]